MEGRKGERRNKTIYNRQKNEQRKNSKLSEWRREKWVKSQPGRGEERMGGKEGGGEEDRKCKEATGGEWRLAGRTKINPKTNKQQQSTHTNIIGRSCHKYNFCRDKHVFVATKVLSRQKFCRDKHTFVVTKDMFCCDKNDTCVNDTHTYTDNKQQEEGKQCVY